jgi:hypothetical protein
MRQSIGRVWTLEFRPAAQPRAGAFRMAELSAFERIQFGDSVAVDALRGRAIVDQPPGAHEQHPGGDDEGVIWIVGGEQHAAPLLAQLRQQFEQPPVEFEGRYFNSLASV